MSAPKFDKNDSQTSSLIAKDVSLSVCHSQALDAGDNIFEWTGEINEGIFYTI